MLNELKNARQIPGEGFRRWFTDADLDLVVWYADGSVREIMGFQLSYDKRSNQHALTWTSRQGFHLSRVDDGEGAAGFTTKMSPVLVPASGFDGSRVHKKFVEAAAGLEYGIVSLASERILEFDRRYRQSKADGETTATQPDLLACGLLDTLRDAFYGPGLHGPSLLPTLRSLDQAQINWQKPPQSAETGAPPFSAWQIALHCAYWKRAVTRQLEAHLGLPASASGHRFELSDWVAKPQQADLAEWQECLDGLCQEHEALVAAASQLLRRDPASLSLVEAHSGFSWLQYVYGMAAHDVYHTAQLRNGGIPGLGED